MNELGLNATDLQARANDRDGWMASWQELQQVYMCNHPFVHADCSPKWRDIFRVHVPRRLGVYLRVVAQEVSFVLLDQTEGMQVFTRWGSLPATLHTWLCWLQLEFTGLLLERPLVEEDMQAYFPQLRAFMMMPFAFSSLSPSTPVSRMMLLPVYLHCHEYSVCGCAVDLETF